MLLLTFYLLFSQHDCYKCWLVLSKCLPEQNIQKECENIAKHKPMCVMCIMLTARCSMSIEWIVQGFHVFFMFMFHQFKSNSWIWPLKYHCKNSPFSLHIHVYPFTKLQFGDKIQFLMFLFYFSICRCLLNRVQHSIEMFFFLSKFI